VYLIFVRNTEWKDQPPAPQDWIAPTAARTRRATTGRRCARRASRQAT